MIKTLAVGFHILFIAAGVRVGTYDKVSVNRGRNEYALAEGTGALEHNMVEKLALGLIKEIILSAGGVYGEAFVAHHAGNVVAVNAGGVHHESGFDVLFTLAADYENAVLFGNSVNVIAELQINAVFNSLLRHGKRHFPRVYNACAGCEKRAHTFRRNIRLHGANLVAGEDFHIRNAVCNAVFVEVANGFHIVFVERENERTAAAERNIQLAADFTRHFVSGNIVFCHKSAGLRIVTRMNNGAVRTGGTHGNVIFPVYQHGFAVEAGKLSCHSASDYTCADNCYIIDQL